MNQKIVTTLVMSSLLASAFAMNAGASASADKKVLKDEQGHVHNIIGTLGKVAGTSAEDRAFAALEKVKTDFGYSQATSHFQVKSSHQDPDSGITHTKLDQTINGIKVFGQQMIVHEQNGELSGVTGSYLALTPDHKRASFTEAQAIEKAVDGATLSSAPTAELVYFPKGDRALLTYRISFTSLGTDAPARYDVFVSAENGSIVEKINKLDHIAAVGTGVGVLGDTKSVNTNYRNGTYYLEDISRPMYTTNGGMIRTREMVNGVVKDMTDADNVWNLARQRAGVDAHVYAGITYQWYYDNVGRNSINGAGGTIDSIVHYSTNYNNAFWDGTKMVYGDGDGTTFRPLSGSLDVVAHELTHGVTEHTSGLIYSNQSGALNESWSDVMACVIDSGDWLIGEDVYTPAIAGDALRSVADPILFGQPDHMSKYVYTTEDNGGVHTNSGIPNKAFYNFATAIGSRNIAGKIWYHAAKNYMTSSTNFSGARAATLQATAALYGSTSSYYTALQNAWTAVGIN